MKFEIDMVNDKVDLMHKVDKLLEKDRGYGLLWKELDMFYDMYNGHESIVEDIDKYFHDIYQLAVNPVRAISKDEYAKMEETRRFDTLSTEDC